MIDPLFGSWLRRALPGASIETLAPEVDDPARALSTRMGQFAKFYVSHSSPVVDIEPLAVARLLAGVVREEAPGLVICGKQAIDNDMNATGQMLAALLGWSQATFASEIAIEGDSAKVTREVDGGLQTITVKMPTIITVDLRLNEPRYASLPNIMKAKAKPLAAKTPADYGVDVSPRLSVLKTVEPAGRKAGVKVGSVAELIAKLKDEAGVL
jgi:electron transfer flavoprotein beta subunit